MSVDLILWRHADARDTPEGLADADRPLSPKGERQAARMARNTSSGKRMRLSSDPP